MKDRSQYYREYQRANRPKINARRSLRHKEHPEILRAKGLRIRYGLTLEQFENMRRKQNDACALCGRTVKQLHVDHNHKTGNVRGLLCVKCNQGLGYFNDDTALLTRAIEYVKKEFYGREKEIPQQTCRI